MVPSLPLLSCESSVSVKENPDRKKKQHGSDQPFYLSLLWCDSYKALWAIFDLEINVYSNFFQVKYKMLLGVRVQHRVLLGGSK